MPSQVRTIVVQDTGARTIQPLVRETVARGSTIVTDEWHAYRGLGIDFDHWVVDHSRKRYVTEEGYTSNAIEGFWSIFKRGIMGIYHQIPRKHLQRYCDEFTYRFNTRMLDSGQRFEDAVGQSGRARLSYQKLIS